MQKPDPLTLAHAVHPGSTFIDTSMPGSRFNDVNLRDATFEDVALTNAVFKNVCFGGVSISDANLSGTTINGILVTELLRVYAEHKESQSPQDQPPGGSA